MIALGLALSAAAMGQAYATAQIFAGVLTGLSPADLAPWFGALAAALGARPVLNFARETTVHFAAGRMKTSLRERLFRAQSDAGILARAGDRAGHRQSLETDGVENLEPYFARYIPQTAVTALTSAAVVVLLVLIDPVVGAVTGTVALAVPLVPRLWDRILADRGASHWQAYEDLNADVVDSLRGMETLKLLGAARRRRDAFRETSRGLLSATLGQLRVSLLESGITALFLVAGPAIALATGIARVQSGALDPVDLFLVVLLSFEAFRPFKELSNHWHAGYMGVSAGRRVLEALEAEPVPQPERQAKTANDGGPAIEADGLAFRYPGSEAYALKDVDFRMEKGSSTAIVGPSGSGKSTLAALLLRLGLPSRGRLLLNGVPTEDLTRDDCTGEIALVSQTPLLFAGSVRDNLRLVAPDAADEELRRALDTAGASELDDTRRGGLDTPVGDSGALLSGGQRQRLAIARALLKNATVLVLDEASSALDARREAEVFDRLTGLSTASGEPVTTVMIAHRLSAVRHADRILVLDEGTLAEEGTWDDLVAADGLFSRLHRAQTTEVTL
ncbi:ABC transporter ATP-binding protein/permease [Salininema proteolyticum]|uniref:ABC transporter ATP-binding protein/permease n=1 Tax=Salininema proteolyticum TaxID=1607685 RepID=A0ABV8TTT9_9ACTN